MTTSTCIRFAILAAAVMGAMGVSSAHAESIDANFKVSLILNKSCSIETRDLAFGAQSSLVGNITASTNFDVTCSGPTEVSVSFSAGTGAGSTIISRKMELEGATPPNVPTIDYNLFKDSLHSDVIGETSGDNTIDFTATSTPSNTPIYGLVPGGQVSKPNGTYSSIITATLTY